MPIVLTELDRRLLALLKAQGDVWLSRSDVAKLIASTRPAPPAKPRLTDTQINELERLSFFGLLEKKTEPIGFGKDQFFYRFVKDE